MRMTTTTTPATASLPDDPALLRATIENLSAQLAEAKRRIQALQHQTDVHYPEVRNGNLTRRKSLTCKEVVVTLGGNVWTQSE
jgi:hypothetical protein